MSTRTVRGVPLGTAAGVVAGLLLVTVAWALPPAPVPLLPFVVFVVGAYGLLVAGALVGGALGGGSRVHGRSAPGSGTGTRAGLSVTAATLVAAVAMGVSTVRLGLGPGGIATIPEVLLAATVVAALGLPLGVAVRRRDGRTGLAIVVAIAAVIGVTAFVRANPEPVADLFGIAIFGVVCALPVVALGAWLGRRGEGGRSESGGSEA